MSEEKHPEIGRPLKASEIKVGMIIVVKPPGYDLYATMDVEEVRNNLIVFCAPKMNWHVINVIGPDDDLKDDRGRVVQVFEYLGDP